MGKGLFREKAIKNVSSPEQLSDYLKTTNPGIWILLLAVVAFTLGMVIWSVAGTIETKIDARAVVVDGSAKVIVTEDGAYDIEVGMPLVIASEEDIISQVGEDEYGRMIAYAEVSLANGTYDANIITERVHLISFLFTGR